MFSPFCNAQICVLILSLQKVVQLAFSKFQSSIHKPILLPIAPILRLVAQYKFTFALLKCMIVSACTGNLQTSIASCSLKDFITPIWFLRIHTFSHVKHYIQSLSIGQVLFFWCFCLRCNWVPHICCPVKLHGLPSESSSVRCHPLSIIHCYCKHFIYNSPQCLWRVWYVQKN